MTDRGQALVEFAGSLAILIPLALAGGSLLLRQWEHLRCQHLAFEKTHSRMMGASPPLAGLNFTWLETPYSVRGTLICPGGSETVELPVLDEAAW